MKQLFKKWHLWVFILVIILSILFFIIYKNNISNILLTKENYKEIIAKYSSNTIKKDNYYYLDYALSYYKTKDCLSNLLTTTVNEKDSLSNLYTATTDEKILYQNIYGKSIKQLINEGKFLMNEHHITIEEYKNNVRKLNSD